MSKKKNPATVYVARQNILSRQHGRYFTPGEVISFDLSEEAPNKPDLEKLLADGLIEVYVEAEEVSDGESSPDSPEIIP